MKWDYRKIGAIVGLLLFILLLGVLNQPDTSWQPSWHHNDTNPYGGKALHLLLRESQGQQVESHFRSLYEVIELDSSLRRGSSILIVCQALTLQDDDWRSLSEYVAAGHTALVASSGFEGGWTDTLGLQTRRYPQTQVESLAGEAQVDLGFSITGFPDTLFAVEQRAALYQLEDQASSAYGLTDLAYNDAGGAVLRHYQLGSGNLFLCSTPLLLSNYHLLREESRGFAAGLLSLIPAGTAVAHFEYYQFGRLQAVTPFRYILRQPMLRAALYLLLTGILIYMVFEARRKQRAIPVLVAPKNASLDFASTLAQLHYHTGRNHSGLARKRLLYLKDFLWRRYHLRVEGWSEAQAQEIKRLSHLTEVEALQLVAMAAKSQEGSLSQEELLIWEGLLHKLYNPQENNYGK